MRSNPESRRSASATAGPTLESVRLDLADGAGTTVHVARFARERFGIRVVAIEPADTVLRWCARNDAEHAIVGGFYVRPGGPPLGHLWLDGIAHATEPFEAPWDERRACLHVDGDRISVAPMSELPAEPVGDLLQAGPLLVAGCRSVIRPGEDVEGFSAGSAQFDSDITAGRYPRAALGITEQELIAIACEGRADDEAGLSMGELAEAMVGFGATTAINLDGGGSTSLVAGGALLNTPREEHRLELVGGRDVATALQFVPR